MHIMFPHIIMDVKKQNPFSYILNIKYTVTESRRMVSYSLECPECTNELYQEVCNEMQSKGLGAISKLFLPLPSQCTTIEQHGEKGTTEPHGQCDWTFIFFLRIVLFYLFPPHFPPSNDFCPAVSNFGGAF